MVLELTEREITDTQVRDELVRLRARGFRIEIDDFGTGHSSLSKLQELEIDHLKIDRAFVSNIDTQDDNQPVLDAIIGLAHRLKIKLIAKGLETDEHAAYLRHKAVQSQQGYLHAKPLTPIDFASWLKSRMAKDPCTLSPFDPLAQPQKPIRMALELGLQQVMQDLEIVKNKLQKNRLHRCKLYPNCLLGNELISWLCSQYKRSRSQALRIGQRLVANGLLEHVVEQHDLEDAPFFYRLTPIDALLGIAGNTQKFSLESKQPLAWLQGTQGVRPGTRYTGALRFNEVVSGAEIAQALTRAGGLSRDQALKAGAQLMRVGLLRHVFDEKSLVDAQRIHDHLGI